MSSVMRYYSLLPIEGTVYNTVLNIFGVEQTSSRLKVIDTVIIHSKITKNSARICLLQRIKLEISEVRVLFNQGYLEFF